MWVVPAVCRVGKSYGEGATAVKKGSCGWVVLAECRVGKNYPGRQGRRDRSSPRRHGLRTWARFLGRCDPVWGLGDRESIFKISHTGEFCGNREVATQTVGSHLSQTGGRRVYKKERRRAMGKSEQ